MEQQLTINYHITEGCNYGCNYCFAHWSDSGEGFPKEEEIWCDAEQWKKLLNELLKMPNIVPGNWLGKPRLNLAGGEPMLLENKGVLSEVLCYARDLGFDLSIITNGSLMKDDFIREWAPHFHTVGISFDSARIDANVKIGRCSRTKKDTISPDRIVEIFHLAREVNSAIVCKINTVVNSFNHEENFVDLINGISPERWKILRMLPLADSQKIRDRQDGMEVTDEQWRDFMYRHEKHIKCRCVPENNDDMTASYVMVNPHGKFYSNTSGANSRHVISYNICEVGAQKAYESLDAKIPLSHDKYSKRYIPVNSIA